jgi:stringent starvation protein B
MMDVSQLTPRRPYLLRAFYEWLLDNQLTPHLVVDVTLPGVLVPMEYARDGQIVLNIAPRASVTSSWPTTKCVLTRALAACRAMSPCRWLPYWRFTRVRMAGTMFEPEAAYDEDVTSLNDDEELPDSETVMSVIDGDKPDNHDDDDDTPPPRGGRPALRVVK